VIALVSTGRAGSTVQRPCLRDPAQRKTIATAISVLLSIIVVLNRGVFVNERVRVKMRQCYRCASKYRMR